MTTLTEGRHTAEFLVSDVMEATGTRSRETATVASGQNLVAGTVVMFSAGKLVRHNGALDSNGLLQTDVAGIIYDNVDATGGDVTGAVYIARDAVVNGAELTYPTQTSGGEEEEQIDDALLELGIIVR